MKMSIVMLLASCALAACAGPSGVRGHGPLAHPDPGPLAGPLSAPYPAAVGQTFRDRDWAPQMVVIPPGRYVMGSSEAETTREKRAPETAAFERPQHEVVFTAPLAVGKYHVSVDDFARFVDATQRSSVYAGCAVDDHGNWSKQASRSYRDPLFPQQGNHPTVCVTWDDASAYAAWLSQETGHHYRLLREEEWEYAARGGTSTARWWGDGSDAMCRYANGADQRFGRDHPGDPQTNASCDDGYAGSSPAGAFPLNPFGLADMLGNAWQWTGDCFRPRYDAPAVADAECKRRVIRGGSWHNASNVLRAANRFSLEPGNRSSSIGFRVARDADL